MKSYKIVKDKGVTVKKTAKMYGVPQQTLRDRALGKVDPVNSGNTFTSLVLYSWPFPIYPIYGTFDPKMVH